MNVQECLPFCRISCKGMCCVQFVTRTLPDPAVRFSKMSMPSLMMGKSSMPQCCFGMMLKSRGTNVFWNPRNLAQDASCLDLSFEHGLICVALQSFGASMSPIFCVLRWTRVVHDRCLSNHTLWKNGEAKQICCKFLL